jgi:hypothetical protein
LPNLNVNGYAGQPDLSALRDELASLTALTSEVTAKIGATLEPPAPPVNLPAALRLPAGPLSRLLWRLLGRRKCLVLRTRFTQLAEAEDGRRQPNGRGRDRVRRAVEIVELDAAD